jgi:hypothetical protein
MLQVWSDPHFGHGNLSVGQLRIAEVASLEQPGERVADLLRHAQLPL